MTLSEFIFLTVTPPLSTLQAFQFGVRYVLLLPSLRILLKYFFSPPSSPSVLYTLSIYSFQ